MIMCHLCNLYTNLTRIFLSCSHIIFLCSVFFFSYSLCLCSQKISGLVDEESTCTKHPAMLLWYNTTVDSGIVVKGLYLLTVSLSQTPPPPPLHLCLKIALDLHVRFLFGLKSWTNYALQFSQTWQRARFPFRRIVLFFFFWRVRIVSLPCYLPPMNVGAVLEL